MACLPEVRERCPLITKPGPPPALPYGLAELDALLPGRAAEMTNAVRGLRTAPVWSFRLTYATQTLPELCRRLEDARGLALRGRTIEAGKKYQAVVVSSQGAAP